MINIEFLKTSFRVKCNRYGYILTTDNIPSKFNIKNIIDNYLTVTIDNSNFLKVNIVKHRHVYYDYINNYVYLPKFILSIFIWYLKYLKLSYKYIYIPETNPKTINIELNTKYKDKSYIQTNVIDFITNIDQDMHLIELQTGIGKTYCSIKSIALLKYKALIISPGNLITQWKEEFLKFTNIQEDEIYIIRGKSSILKLFSRKIDIDKYKIYISTINTIYKYISDNELYKDIPNLYELINYLGIGIKVIDEVHLNFKQILNVDLISNNVKKNIYLSATYIRTDKTSNKIFQKYFNNEYRFNINQYNKYVNITEYHYNLCYKNINNLTKTHKGYSQIKYEKLLLKKKKLFKECMKYITKCIDDFYLNKRYNKKEKCLILINYKEFGIEIHNYLSKIYNNLKIGMFFYEHTKDILENLHIIISTVQSSGTGLDIKNLRTIILFASFQANGLNKQCLGRLRELKKGNGEFIFMVNDCIASHINHSYKRKWLFRNLCKNYNIILSNEWNE